MDTTTYMNNVNTKAYTAFKKLDNLERELSEALDLLGWSWQSFSYQVFKDFGLYEIYNSNDTFNGSFISDKIGDIFYLSNSLEEVYDGLTHILLELEAHPELYKKGKAV